MNLNTAASIGLGLLKHRDELAAGLKGLAGLAKDSGQGFAKIAERFHLDPAKLEKIADRVAQAPIVPNGSTTEALMALRYFDKDQNGSVSREELQQGLQSLESSGLAGQEIHRQLYQIGSKMLANYDKLASLDAKTGLGYGDVIALAGRDGRMGEISSSDWQALSPNA